MWAAKLVSDMCHSLVLLDVPHLSRDNRRAPILNGQVGIKKYLTAMKSSVFLSNVKASRDVYLKPGLKSF